MEVEIRQEIRKYNSRVTDKKKKIYKTFILNQFELRLILSKIFFHLISKFYWETIQVKKLYFYLQWRIRQYLVI